MAARCDLKCTLIALTLLCYVKQTCLPTVHKESIRSVVNKDSLTVNARQRSSKFICCNVQPSV